jgi:HSP20 family protein
MSLTRYQSSESNVWPTLNRFSALRDDLNSLFELPLLGEIARNAQLFSGWSPALDLYQDKDTITAVVELPGMNKDEIEISLHDGTLTIAGERKAQASNGNGNGNGQSSAHRSERYVGKFRRTISLPAAVDANKVTASYRDGILTVSLPKAEEAKPKQIPVNVS